MKLTHTVLALAALLPTVSMAADKPKSDVVGVGANTCAILAQKGTYNSRKTPKFK
jgi:hypothetical protein